MKARQERDNWQVVIKWNDAAETTIRYSTEKMARWKVSDFARSKYADSALECYYEPISAYAKRVVAKQNSRTR